MAVRDIDRGYDRLLEQLDELGGGLSTTVGIHSEQGGEDHPGGGGTILEIAALQEFGTERQPPRSFVRAGFDENETAIGRGMVRAACAVARGEAKLEDAFGELGLELRDRMLEKMDEAPPLADETVELKGSTTLLSETGTIREALRVRVNNREVR